MRYLSEIDRVILGEFLSKPLWREIKLCLADRRPPTPDTGDPSHVAAAKGHKRAGFELTIESIEKLPIEFDDTPKDPFSRPAVAITQD